jgi:hypothetical protein
MNYDGPYISEEQVPSDLEWPKMVALLLWRLATIARGALATILLAALVLAAERSPQLVGLTSAIVLLVLYFKTRSDRAMRFEVAALLKLPRRRDFIVPSLTILVLVSLIVGLFGLWPIEQTFSIESSTGHPTLLAMSNMDSLLGIASFAISIGGLLPLFFLKERRRRSALLIVMILLIIATGGTVYGYYQRAREIARVEAQIIDDLMDRKLTFDQISADLVFHNSPIVNLALERALEAGRIGERLTVVRSPDGEMLQVRVYYVRQ